MSCNKHDEASYEEELTYCEHLKAAKAIKECGERIIAAGPEACRKVLQEVGVLNSSGELSEYYR